MSQAIQSVNHYENFPVASWLVPSRLRPAIQEIYWFARSADDIADEGRALPSARRAALGVYREHLERIEQGDQMTDPHFRALASVIRSHRLPIQLFSDLLTAFEADCERKRQFTDWESLHWYCRHSANPVGRIILHLFACFDEENALASDNICTSLQLINFLQDIRHDWHVDRLYVPLDELTQFGASLSDIEQASANRYVAPTLEQTLKFQHERAANLMRMGYPLLPKLPGRMGIEIRATVAGGERMLDLLKAQQYSGFAGRPKLGTGDWISVLIRALLGRFKQPQRG